MPHISVTCPSGTYQFFYSISTPGSCDAPSIVNGLPVVLFIHSGYNSQEVFEAQFSDPELRRFNLIAIDVPGHGATLGYIGDKTYTPTDTAHDFKCVMEALKLPPAHLFGLSNGGTVAMELACAYPESILSLTICSPLTPVEPEDVVAGRMQVFDYWIQTFKDGHGRTPEERKRQDEILGETLVGAMQLLHNNETSPLLTAAGRCAMSRAIDNWSGSRAKLKQSAAACITWFIERRVIPDSELAKIQCPVHIIHCSEDIAYPLENAEALLQKLKQVGISHVQLHQVTGPHYGNIVSAENMNYVLRDTVLRTHQLGEVEHPVPNPDLPGGRMRTPWTDLMRRFGYDAENADEDDEDDWPFTSWFDLPPVVEVNRRANSPRPGA